MFYYFIIIYLADYLIIESNMLQKVSFSKKIIFYYCKILETLNI